MGFVQEYYKKNKVKIVKKGKLILDNILKGKLKFNIIPKERSIDIDDINDFKKAKDLISKN